MKETTVTQMIERLVKLNETDPVAVWDVWRILTMMQHRSITPKDLALEAGKSETTVYFVLKGQLPQTRAARTRLLTRLDDAITAITVRNGGCCSNPDHVLTGGVS